MPILKYFNEIHVIMNTNKLFTVHIIIILRICDTHSIGVNDTFIINSISISFMLCVCLCLGQTCNDITCLNGGTCQETGDGPNCTCPIDCQCGTMGTYCQWIGKLSNISLG